MANAYSKLVGAIKRSPALARLALRMQRLVPDRPVTRDIAGLGPLRFRIRRHRWLLGDNPLGGHHAHTLSTFRFLIRPGDVVYDIGANIGYYSRFILNELAPAKLVAFEPMSENAELLEANISLGQHESIASVLRVALADHDGRENLQVDDIFGGTAVLDSISQGSASQSRRRLGLEPKTETVAVRRLDGLLAETDLPAPAFMKIDTEGAEASVLAGAVETLRTSRPRLAIALHGLEPARKTIELLDGLGCEVRAKVTDESAWQTIHVSDAERIANNNIIAGWDLPPGGP